FFFLYAYSHHHDLHSFPTRRSSDLPRILPNWPMTIVSIKNWVEMVARFAPRAFLTPISRVRSLTETNIIFINAMEEPRMVMMLRSEEHTSELQSRENLVCRLLLEKK